jgi:hypothetical protein
MGGCTRTRSPPPHSNPAGQAAKERLGELESSRGGVAAAQAELRQAEDPALKASMKREELEEIVGAAAKKLEARRRGRGREGCLLCRGY